MSAPEQLAPWESMEAPISVDRLLVVPLAPLGMWEAIRSLRHRMRELRGSGAPRAVFLVALDPEGEQVAPLDPSATTLVLGYRLD